MAIIPSFNSATVDMYLPGGGLVTYKGFQDGTEAPLEAGAEAVKDQTGRCIGVVYGEQKITTKLGILKTDWADWVSRVGDGYMFKPPPKIVVTYFDPVVGTRQHTNEFAVLAIESANETSPAKGPVKVDVSFVCSSILVNGKDPFARAA